MTSRGRGLFATVLNNQFSVSDGPRVCRERSGGSPEVPSPDSGCFPG